MLSGAALLYLLTIPATVIVALNYDKNQRPYGLIFVALMIVTALLLCVIPVIRGAYWLTLMLAGKA